MNRTELHTPVLQGLRAKTRDLVRAAGGQEAAAEFCTRKRRHQHYSDIGLPNGELFASVDVILDLERVTAGSAGHPIVTRYLAQQQGLVLVEVPPVSTVELVNVREAIARHAKESGEATAHAIAALFEPNKAGRAEALREMDQAIEAAVIARALIAQLGDDD